MECKTIGCSSIEVDEHDFCDLKEKVMEALEKRQKSIMKLKQLLKKQEGNEIDLRDKLKEQEEEIIKLKSETLDQEEEEAKVGKKISKDL